ncbi:MAG: arylsulfatase [Planctomycetota bacterium]
MPHTSIAASDDASAPFPNIIILYADDMGLGDPTCYNPDSKIPTPNIDKLAADGAMFLDGHSSSGICTPSRYALLTGRHHWRDFHGIVNSFGKSVFRDEQLTMPEMLQENGYHTACIGKWHLGWDWNAIKTDQGKANKSTRKQGFGPDDFDWTKRIPDGPLAHGFDHYFGDTVINFPPYAWIEDNQMLQVPDTMKDEKTWPKIKEGNWECRGGPMVTGWNPYEVLPTLGDRAVKYVESHKDNKNPFFLFFAYPSPHAPIIPNDEFDGKSQAGPYGDFVYETDHIAGRILDALDKAGMTNNTIVIFTADNGPEHYAYARDKRFGHWSSYPLRGLKRHIYEGGHRVPFIIRWPGVTRAGSVKDGLISQIDLFATFATMLGYDLPEEAAADSLDLMPYLKGETDSARTSHVHNTWPGLYAMRDGDWLLINAPSGYRTNKQNRDAAFEATKGYTHDHGLPVELYNLNDDIGQRNNLADKHPDKVKALQQLLKKIQKDGRTRPTKP